MVYLYIADISALPEPLENAQIMEELSEERQKKIRNTKQKQNRLQRLGAGLLLHQVFCRQGVSEDTLADEPIIPEFTVSENPVAY